jgi:hypothetical protein
MRFRPDRWTTWVNRAGGMPRYCRRRANPKGQGKFPRCHSPVPNTDIVRSGVKPPVPRDRFCLLSNVLDTLPVVANKVIFLLTLVTFFSTIWERPGV